MTNEPKLPKEWEDRLDEILMDFDSEREFVYTADLRTFLQSIHAQHSAEVEGLRARIGELEKSITK